MLDFHVSITFLSQIRNFHVSITFLSQIPNFHVSITLLPQHVPNYMWVLPSYLNRYLTSMSVLPFCLEYLTSMSPLLSYLITYLTYMSVLPSYLIRYLGLQGISCWIRKWSLCKFFFRSLWHHLYRLFGATYWLYPEDETLSLSETCVPHPRLHGVLIQKTTVWILHGSRLNICTKFFPPPPSHVCYSETSVVNKC